MELKDFTSIRFKRKFRIDNSKYELWKLFSVKKFIFIITDIIRNYSEAFL